MDLTYPAEAEEFREQARAFLDEHLPPDWEGIGALPPDEREVFHDEWRRTLRDAKLLAPHWPAEYGGSGLSHLEHVVLNEEFAKRGVPTMGANDGFSISMVGNTILHWGTEEQKRHFIPRILDGTDVWCQGYSEPNAGSDLANLGLRAVRDGDEWVINGQKTWTSQATTANMIFALCRTDPDAPKHRGISFLLVPMDQPGVEVRPIRDMGGHAHVNEVFFEDARAPVENVLGEVNGGWAVANTLLGFERGVRGTVLYLPFREEFDNFVELARERGKLDDPIVRQEIARFHTAVELIRYGGLQSLTKFLTGEPPGPESSLTKLRWSHHHREITEAALRLAGPDGQVGYGTETRRGIGGAPPGTPNTIGNWMNSFFVARAGTIYAGSTEVQKGIIGERVLGLPKEPRADEGSWRDLQKTRG
jgi:alkylation response protein AidB-like acyl-CoA dehydrogenase